MTKRERCGRGVFFLAAVFLFAGCGTKELTPDAAKIEGGVYKNFYFDIVLPVPEGWTAKTPAPRMSHFLEFYLEALATKKDTGSEKRVFPMVRMATTPAGSLRPTDAVITLAAARISDKYGMDRAHAVKIARLFVKGSPTPVRLTKDFHSEKLGEKTTGGITFVAFEVEWTEKQGGVLEAFYIALRRDYALVFSVEAKNQEALEKGKNVLKSIAWRGAIPPAGG